MCNASIISCARNIFSHRIFPLPLPPRVLFIFFCFFSAFFPYFFFSYFFSVLFYLPCFRLFVPFLVHFRSLVPPVHRSLWPSLFVVSKPKHSLNLFARATRHGLICFAGVQRARCETAMDANYSAASTDRCSISSLEFCVARPRPPFTDRPTILHMPLSPFVRSFVMLAFRDLENRLFGSLVRCFAPSLSHAHTHTHTLPPSLSVCLSVRLSLSLSLSERSRPDCEWVFFRM